MAVLSTSQNPGVPWAEVGRRIAAGIAWVLFAVGWLAARSLRAVATGLGALLFAAGWVTAAVVWPALCWCGRAVRLGWREGQRTART